MPCSFPIYLRRVYLRWIDSWLSWCYPSGNFMSKRLSILTLTMLVIACGWSEAPIPVSPSVVAGGYSVPQLTGFNIVRDVNVLVVHLGGSTTKTILVVPNENGGYEVELGVLGLPKGVTVSFSSNPVSVGTPVIMTLTADANGSQLQNIPITVAATRAADGAQAELKLWLSVAAPIGQTPPSRHDLLPLSGTPTQGVFDPVRRLLFVNNPEWNRVEVIAVDRKEIVRSIPVPSPMGMDLSPDGKTVLVGTWTPQMFAIDTASLKVVKRYVLPPPFRLSATFPAQMANGRVLLLADDGGGRSLILWDLATNSATRVPFQTLNGSVDMIRKAANGSRALLASSSSSGLIAIYDAATDHFTKREWFGKFLSIAAVSPNGEQMVFFDDVGLAVYDPNFRLVGYLPSGPYGGRLSGAVYSPEGRRIHLVLNSDLTPTVVTVDAATLRLLGTAPAIPMRPPPPIDRAPPFDVSVPFGADTTGIVYGGLPHGIAYEDATYFQNYNGQTGSPIYNNALDPRSGPVDAATRVGFWWGNAFSFVSDVWFGENRGLEPALNFPQQLSVTAPPSSRRGPVNVKLIQPNGIMVYNAQGFSYGPHILEVVGNMASPNGGTTADVLVLGVPSDVSQIEVKIGANDAQVLSATRVRYDHQPVVRVRVSVPPGTPGDADVTLITTTGSMTLPKQFRYVNAVEDYAPMSKYVSLTYDRFRNELYLSAADHLDVFSLGFSSYANPIKIPSLSGKMQLSGTALTPDGSRLLVTNTADGSVAILDPDNPSNVQVVPVTEPEQFGYPPCVRGPLTIAAANNGKALMFTGSVPEAGCGPGGQLKYVDYRTANLTTGPFVSPGCGSAYVSATRDGSKIATGGTVRSGPGFCIYDAATDSVTNVVDFYSMGAAAAGDGNVFAGAESFYGVFADGNGEVLGRPARPPEMFDSDFGVLGQIKFNGPGSLLYRPQEHFVDLFDAKRGDFRVRLLLKQTVRNVIDALALNGDGTQMYLLTDAGLTVVDIGRLPLSVGHVEPTALVPGTQLTIRGSGFGPDMVVSLNGNVVPTVYIDSSTLQLTVPTMPSGPVDISIANGTGESYTVDNAAQIFWPLLPPREF
jgi:IPT/TIG domain